MIEHALVWLLFVVAWCTGLEIWLWRQRRYLRRENTELNAAFFDTVRHMIAVAENSSKRREKVLGK